MALELYEGALKDLNGRFYEDSAFQINEANLEAFDKMFPHKEKKAPEK